MRIAIHQPHYMPWLGYLHKIKEADIFVYLDKVAYEKNGFQNRNRIMIDDREHWFTVPVLTKGKLGQSIKDVEVNWNRPTCEWNDKHYRTLLYNYLNGKKDKQEKMMEFYDFKGKLLVDWCIRSVELLCQAFGIKTPIILESDLDVDSTNTERLVNICKVVNADTYLPGPGGRDYMDESIFDNIKVEYIDWKPKSRLSALHFYLMGEMDVLEEK